MGEPTPSKVVDLAARRPPAQAVELLTRLRDGAILRAGALLKTALDQVDDALFGISEKSETGAGRSQYFDAMRDLRLKRPGMERQFRERLASRFAEFARHRGAPPASPSATAAIDSDGLSLVDDTQLEESLALAGMASKGATRYNSALYALNQRFAALVGAKEVTDVANPLGPHALCAALEAAMREFEAAVAIKLVILKLFDRHVITELDQLYADANGLLKDAGILPHIKFTLPARAPGSEAAKPAEKPAEKTADKAEPAADAADAVRDIMQSFATLLAARRRAARGGVDVLPAGPALAEAELIGALALLQNELTVADSFAFDGASATETVERVKRDLIDQLRRLGIKDPDRRVGSADEDAIDLVSMLFQFVVQDRNLPAEIQAVLGRLQIPYVRVAIKDKHFFAQKEHPARQLLNALAEASVGWSTEADRDGRLLGKLSEVVDRVVREYADDFGLFEDLARDFETFIGQQKKRAEIAEQRATEAAQGRERLNQARRHAGQAVRSRMAGRELPVLVRDLLLNPWTNFLVLTHLRQGMESKEWKSAVNFIDALIWAAAPKQDDGELARLRALLPQVQAYLGRSLAVVGYHESDAARLVEGLSALLESQRKPGARVEISAPAVAAAEATVQAVAAKTASHAAPAAADEEDDEEIIPPAAILPDDDQYLATVRAMKVGTWLEFDGIDGTRERAKLSWISPISARFLFVNRKGLKVAERNLFTLAVELREGRVRILEQAPIFDRALDQIMQRLRSEQMASA